MNRFDLQRLAILRLKEAKVLLDSACYEGAYYLAGYAVECAVKACIAKKTNRYDFPDKALVSKAYTHNLEDLLKLAGLQADRKGEERLSREFEVNWSIVKDWSEDERYDTSVPEKAARDLHAAVASRKAGVLS